MNKTLIGAIISIGVLGVAAGGGYYFYSQNKKPALTFTDTVVTPAKCQTAPVITSFTSDLATVKPNAAVKLSWVVTGAESVAVDNIVVVMAADATTVTVNPKITTIYTLTATCAEKTVTSTVTVKVDPYLGWKKYTDKVLKYTFKYNNKWKLRTCAQDTGMPPLVFFAPTSKTLGLCNTEYFGKMYGGAVDGDQRNDYALTSSNYSGIKSKDVVFDGVSGKRMEGKLKATQEMGSPKGTRIIHYYFYKSGYTYFLAYIQEPKGTLKSDNSSDFDLTAESLTF